MAQQLDLKPEKRRPYATSSNQLSFVPERQIEASSDQSKGCKPRKHICLWRMQVLQWIDQPRNQSIQG